MTELLKNLKCGDSVVATRSLFQVGDGGAIPTSPHQLEMVEITNKVAGVCYEKWHYLGKTEFLATHNFGVFVNGELMGCISYGAPNATELKGYFNRYTQNGWREIKRLALSDYLPKNSESRVIAVSIRLLKKIEKVAGIVTYADSGVGHCGTIYKASGFNYLGLTAPKKDFYVDGKIQQRGGTKGKVGEWKDRSRKQLFVKRFV